MITVGQAGPLGNELFQAFQNFGVNMVSAYGYHTWRELTTMTALHSAMSIVRITGYFDYEVISDALSTSG
jgi:hypothetical protein